MSFTNENLNHLVTKAVLSSVDNERQQSEIQLFQLRANEPYPFFTALVDNFMNPNLDASSRVANATILMKSLEDNLNNTIYWQLAPNEIKDRIQAAGLNSLIDKDSQIQRVAANIVSKVFILRFRFGNKWDDLLGNLANNCNNDNSGVQKASITTIGYICEELEKWQFDLSESEVETILQSICVCINENQQVEQIKHAGLKAFQYASFYFSTIMQKENILTYVMDLIVKCTLLDKNSPDIVTMAFNCLTDISRNIYDNLYRYMDVIATFCANSINNGPDSVKMAAMELLNMIAQEEEKRMKSQDSTNLLKSEINKDYVNKHYIYNKRNDLLPVI